MNTCLARDAAADHNRRPRRRGPSDAGRRGRQPESSIVATFSLAAGDWSLRRLILPGDRGDLTAFRTCLRASAGGLAAHGQDPHPVETPQLLRHLTEPLSDRKISRY